MMLLLVGGVRGLRTQSAANGWVIFGAPTEAHSLHQLLAFANIQGAILALHLAQETIVDEGWCLSWGGGLLLADALPPKWPFWRASAAILWSASLRCSGSIS